MRAIAVACASHRIPANVQVVVSPSPDAPALDEARKLGLSTAIAEAPEDLLNAFQGCNYICLAGFMRLLPAEILRAFPNRVLNIHPALLPKYGGKGMYGMKVHEAVLAAGEAESGCTVHLVNEQYDEGAILLQMRIPVMPDETPESLAKRVLQLEHEAYPLALKQVIESA